MRSSIPILLTKILNVLVSACLCVFGIILIAVPTLPSDVAAITVGVLLILLGAFKLAGYFSRDLYRLAFQYDIQLGIVVAVLGAACLINGCGRLDFTKAAFGAAALVDGAFSATIAKDAKKFGVKPWLAILACSAVASTAGAALIVCPAQSERVTSVILGIALALEGISHSIVILSSVKVINHQLPDNLSDKDD